MHALCPHSHRYYYTYSIDTIIKLWQKELSTTLRTKFPSQIVFISLQNNEISFVILNEEIPFVDRRQLKPQN